MSNCPFESICKPRQEYEKVYAEAVKSGLLLAEKAPIQPGRIVVKGKRAPAILTKERMTRVRQVLFARGVNGNLSTEQQGALDKFKGVHFKNMSSVHKEQIMSIYRESGRGAKHASSK